MRDRPPTVLGLKSLKITVKHHAHHPTMVGNVPNSEPIRGLGRWQMGNGHLRPIQVPMVSLRITRANPLRSEAWEGAYSHPIGYG